MNQTRPTGIEVIDRLHGGIPSRPLLWSHMFFLGRHGNEFFDHMRSLAAKEGLLVSALENWDNIPETDILLVSYKDLAKGPHLKLWENTASNVRRLKKISMQKSVLVLLQVRLPPRKYREVNEKGGVSLLMAPSDEIERSSDIVTSNWGTRDEKIWGCHKFMDFEV